MENLKNEIWKYIIGYEGYYMVSNMGRVKSLDRVVFLPTMSIYRNVKGKILSFGERCGYFYIGLHNNKKVEVRKIHRLVAETFLKKEVDSHNIVNHINKNIKDNRAENLEWCNQRENSTHGLKRIKTSKYTGVRWVIRDSKWRADIYVNKKSISLGTFFNEIEASNAYQKALVQYGVSNRYSK
jgi:hypothetical protein